MCFSCVPCQLFGIHFYRTHPCFPAANGESVGALLAVVFSSWWIPSATYYHACVSELLSFGASHGTRQSPSHSVLFFLATPDLTVTPFLRRKLSHRGKQLILVLCAYDPFGCICYHCYLRVSYPPEHGSSERLFYSELSYCLSEHTLINKFQPTDRSFRANNRRGF